jgi:hypothetical protein
VNVSRKLSQRQQEKAPERRPAHHSEEEDGADHDHGKPDTSGDAGVPADSRFVEVV